MNKFGGIIEKKRANVANWKHHKLAKWGDGDEEMGTYNSQELYEDQVIIVKTLYSGRF